MGISAGVGNTGTVPVGVVNPFAGTVAPAGWLLCAGQAVSRTEYSGLFLTIGTTYGVGNGSSTFNLPDMRGRVVAGVDNMGGTAASRLTNTVLSASNTLGATGGSQTHTLTTAQIPAHRHPSRYEYLGLTSGGLFRHWITDNPTGGGSGNNYMPIGLDAGGGAAHTNTQPTIVLNYIIKAA